MAFGLRPDAGTEAAYITWALIENIAMVRGGQRAPMGPVRVDSGLGLFAFRTLMSLFPAGKQQHVCQAHTESAWLYDADWVMCRGTD